jgi:TPR repeat protein
MEPAPPVAPPPPPRSRLWLILLALVPPPPRSRLWLILLALVLLGAAGGAAWWYLNPEPVQPVVTPEEPPAEEQPPAEEGAQPSGSACAAGAAARLGAEDAAAAQWLEVAEACRAEGGGEALVEILDACMAAGHPECLVEMGRCYDPRYEASAACGITLYPEIAADYYSRAAEAGAEGAAAELESLCGHLNETSPEQAVLAGC